MEQDIEKDMEEMRDELAEDMRVTREKNDNILPFLLFGAVGAFILIIILILSSDDDDKPVTDDLVSIKSRIEQLESKLSISRKDGEKTGEQEVTLEKLRQSISELDRSKSALTKRMDILSQQVAQLQERMAALSSQGSTSRAISKKPNPLPEKRYHEVRRGDTLFGIAKTYGVTVDQLRRLNGLTRSQDIHPGQKILISQSSP